MKKLIFLCILLFCSTAYAGNLMMIGGGVPVAAGGTNEDVGNTSVEASTAYGSTDYMYCYKLESTPHAGTVQSFTMTLNASGGSSDVSISIYNHDATNDLPSTVVTNSSLEKTLTTSSLTDETFSYVTKPTISASQYWLCLSNSGDTNNIQYTYEDASGPRVAYKNITYGTFPDWSGTGTVVDGGRRFGKMYITNQY